MPQISFLIVNWNGLPVLPKCLQSIESTCHELSYEVLVADNNSTDDSVSVIRKQFPQVKLLQNHENLFFAAPTNTLARQAKGNFLMLMNNDIVLKKNAMARLLKTLQESKRTGAAVPQLLYPDGRVQPSCRRLPTLLSLALAGTGLDNFFTQKSWKMKDWNHSNKRCVEQPMMSAMLIKRECWLDVGELDQERFPLYFNDVDWCKRAIAQGWEIKFDPLAQAIHFEAWSGKKLGFKQAIYSSIGMYRYFRKYHVKTVFSLKWPILTSLILSFLGVKGVSLGARMLKGRIFNPSKSVLSV